MIFHDTRRIADRNATCQETRRVGECHGPDTRDTACHDKSFPGYVNRGVSKNFKGLILNDMDIFCRRMNVFCVPHVKLVCPCALTTDACALLSLQNFIVKKARRTYGRLFSCTSLAISYYEFIILR